MSETVTFAVNLHVNDDHMRAAMAQMCSLIADDMGLEVSPLTAHAPSALTELLADGSADFAWVSPTLLLSAPQLAHFVPLLSSVRQGAAFFHSVVFTGLSSFIDDLARLRGMRAAWVAPTSAAGYMVPRLTLARGGVNMADAFRSETFYDTHGDVARAVFSGKADLGGTYAHFENGDNSRELIHAGYQDAGKFSRARILAVSGPIPADMIVASPEMPITRRIAFAAALCRLAHDAVGGPALRQVIGADDFAPVSPQALEELQSLMEAARDLELY